MTKSLSKVEMLAAFALMLAVPPREADHAATGAGAAGVAGDFRETQKGKVKPSTKQIVTDTFTAFNDDRTMAVSAGATFYGLLALFPAIASFVSIYGLFADSHSINDQLATLSGFLPGGAVDIIREQVARISSKGQAALSGAFAIGLATSLWSANAGIKAMFDALNIAYGLKEKRNFFVLNAVALGFTLCFLLAIVIAAILLVALPPLVERLLPNGVGSTLILLARWPLLFVGLSLAIALLYRYGPTPQDQHWRWLTPGSIIAAILWCVVSSGFSYYAAHFGSYNATYGSLGAAIGTMTWMWLSITVILLGAELNAQIDKSTDAKRENPKG